MSPESIQSFIALAIGFATAGLFATGFQLLTRKPASFSLLQRGARPSTLAAVPFLAFAAPFVIMRNTLRATHLHERRTEFVAVATVVAGFWSLMSGTIVVMVLGAALDFLHLPLAN